MTTLNRTASNWSAQERAKINENWEILERLASQNANGSNGLRAEVEQLKLDVISNRNLGNRALILAMQADENATRVLTVAQDATISADLANANAQRALNNAATAVETANNVQRQLDNVVADGNSNAEVVQSRGEFSNLRQRLDTERNRATRQRIEIDDRNFANPLTYTRNVGPTMALVDDDGTPEAYNLLRPIAISEGVPISLAVVTSRIGVASNSMNLQQLRECQDVGMEIVSHTHTHQRTSTLTVAQQEDEFRLSKEYLQQNGFNSDVVVYPFGSADATTMRIAERYYKLGVYIDYGESRLNYSPINQFRLERVYFNNVDENNVGSNYVQLCMDKIDEAIATNGLLVIGMHAFYSNFDTAGLVEVIRYAKQRGIKITNLKGVLERYGNIINLPNFIVGANGEITSDRVGTLRIIPNTTANLMVTGLTPLSYFQIGVSRCIMPAGSYDGLPVQSAGSLTTYRATSDYLSYQEFQVYYDKRIYRRLFDAATASWGNWFLTYNPYFISSDKPLNAVNGNTLLDQFDLGVTRSLHANTASYTNMPALERMTVVTNKYTTASLSYQEARVLRNNYTYSRNWNETLNNWDAWVRTSPGSVGFTVTFDYGTIPANSCVRKSITHPTKYLGNINYQAQLEQEIPLGLITNAFIRQVEGSNDIAYFDICNVTSEPIVMGSAVWNETVTSFN